MNWIQAAPAQSSQERIQNNAALAGDQTSCIPILMWNIEETYYALQALLSIKLMSVCNSPIVINDLSLNLQGWDCEQSGTLRKSYDLTGLYFLVSRMTEEDSWNDSTGGVQ